MKALDLMVTGPQALKLCFILVITLQEMVVCICPKSLSSLRYILWHRWIVGLMNIFRYLYSFPFLDSNGKVSVDNNCVGPLYEHVFAAAFGASLSFVGLPWKVDILVLDCSFFLTLDWVTLQICFNYLMILIFSSLVTHICECCPKLDASKYILNTYCSHLLTK